MPKLYVRSYMRGRVLRNRCLIRIGSCSRDSAAKNVANSTTIGELLVVGVGQLVCRKIVCEYLEARF